MKRVMLFEKFQTLRGFFCPCAFQIGTIARGTMPFSPSYMFHKFDQWLARALNSPLVDCSDNVSRFLVQTRSHFSRKEFARFFFLTQLTALQKRKVFYYNIVNVVCILLMILAPIASPIYAEPASFTSLLIIASFLFCMILTRYKYYKLSMWIQYWSYAWYTFFQSSRLTLIEWSLDITNLCSAAFLLLGPSQALVIYLLSVIISASVLRYYHGPLLSQPQFLPIIVKLIWHFAVTTLNSSIFMVARGKLELERRHKTEFLSRMSHELRSPLVGVIQSANDLLQGLSDPSGTMLREEVLEIADTIKSCSNTILSLINDVLDVSKIAAGSMTIREERVDLRELFRLVSQSVCPTLRHRNIELRVNIHNDVPTYITGDKLRLQQILSNLATNAVKYTEHGYIELSAHVEKAKGLSRGPDILCLACEDTGIGINPNDLKKLFKAFEQIHIGFSRQYGGTGLGLFLIRTLTEQMGGTVSCTSTPNKGTKFEVKLPLRIWEGSETNDVPKRSTELPLIETEDAYSDYLLPVLLAEDNPLNQKVFQKQIEEAGFKNVIVAENGKKVIELIEKAGDPCKFAALLLDREMPVMNGVETADYLHEKGWNKSLRVIGFTAYALDVTRQELQAHHVERCLIKPTTTEAIRMELLDAIKWRRENMKYCVSPLHHAKE